MTDNNINNNEKVYSTVPVYEQQPQIHESFSLVKPEMYQHANIDHLNTNAFIQNDEALLFLKIKNELIPHWKKLSIESISSYIDSIINIVKQKEDVSSIMKKLEEQYNKEIRNFNHIMEQNINKMKEMYLHLNTIMSIKSNSNKQNQAYLFLKEQVNYLLNEQKEHLNVISVLKGEKIKLENELRLKELNEMYVPYNNDLNSRIKDNIMVDKLNMKIDGLMKEMKDYNYSDKTYNHNKNSFSISKDSYSDKVYNDCLVNVIKNINDKDKQIEILNKKIGKLTEKHIIDADNNKHNQIEQIQNSKYYNNQHITSNKGMKVLQEHSNDLTKFEEILRLKNEISKK